MLTVQTRDLIGELTPIETRFAPPTLFLEGNPALLQQPGVAIIGSRQSSDDGLKRAARLARILAGQAIRPTNFTSRNRTMALLSDATVIIEAQFNSGTRYQGWEAIRLGRPVFIAQSLVDRGPRWVGEMVRSGARVLNERTIPELVAVKRLAQAV